MVSVPVYVGLDYHDKSVQVCVLDRAGTVLANRRCANGWQDIWSFAERHGTVIRAAMESCCGSADLAQELVDRGGWSMDLAHPGYVRRMKGNPDKTDYSDARILADLTRVGYLPKVWMAPEAIRELRRLVRYRQGLAHERRNVKLRIRALLREQRLKGPERAWSRPWYAWLRDHAELSEQGRWVIDQLMEQLASVLLRIQAAEQRLEQVTADDPMVAHLRSYAGIGPITAWTIRAEIGRFDRFVTGKQVARFCGLSPRNASSGERQADAGLIKAGNGELRAVLIEAAHRLCRHSPRGHELAQRLKKAGKPGSVIAAAVANRWIRWLFHQMKETSYIAA